VRSTERRCAMTEEQAIKKVVSTLEGDWKFYYAEIDRGVFCVFEVETMKPVKYLETVNDARFWVTRYQTNTQDN
jgi:hypothetical protein